MLDANNTFPFYISGTAKGSTINTRAQIRTKINSQTNEKLHACKHYNPLQKNVLHYIQPHKIITLQYTEKKIKGMRKYMIQGSTRSKTHAVYSRVLSSNIPMLEQVVCAHIYTCIRTRLQVTYVCEDIYVCTYTYVHVQIHACIYANRKMLTWN